jgi:hypothetical protein
LDQNQKPKCASGEAARPIGANIAKLPKVIADRLKQPRCHSMGHEHSQRGRRHGPDAKPCIDPDQNRHSGSDGQQSDLAHLNAPLHSAHQFHPEENAA